jgi:hypothetical protein
MPRYLAVPLVAVLTLLASPVGAAARDRDHDGIADKWERRHGLSTQEKSGRADPDRDGLSNRREFRLKTNPRKKDTDGDRLRDRAEVRRYKTNPRKRDTDGDKLGDRAEIRRYKTNPRKRDTDGDGLSDRVELRRTHTDPRKKDTDGDGISDGREVAAGSDPLTPSPAPPPASPGSPRPGGFPSPATTGVPAGWAPAETRTSDLRITQPGAVVQDVLLQNADILVDAPNVTLRRVKLQGGSISNFTGNPCQSNMVIEDSTVEPSPGAQFSEGSEGVIQVGGYTARRVKIWRRAEGFRSGADCGPIRIEDSFASIATPSGTCSHADGIQGANGPWTTMVNTTIDFREVNCGTAPFFFPQGQGNDGVTIDRLLVMGGGYPFRLGAPGSVSGLRIVDRSWEYGPIMVNCPMLTSWEAAIVNIDANYQVTRNVKSQPCNTGSS